MRRARESLWVIVLAALLLRLFVAAFVYQRLLDPITDYWPFGWEVGRIARSLASGQGFANPLFHQTGPTAWMAPAFPWLLAGLFRVLGIYTKASALAILFLNSSFSALTCIPIFYLARISFGGTVAAWSAWVWAVFPYAVDLATDRVWETCLSALLLTALVAMTLHLARASNWKLWVGYGVLWGIAALTNPALLSVFPALLAWACYRLHRENAPWLKPCALCVLLVFAIVSPWIGRNYVVFHRWIPLRDNFWLEMWVGNNGDTSDWFTVQEHPTGSDQELREYEQLGELAYMQQKQADTVAYIRNHPGSFVFASFRRIIFTWTGFWSFNRRYLAENRFDLPNIGFCSALTILMLLGLRQAFRQSPTFAVPFALVLLFYPLIYYLTHAALFYRHPIDPLIVILAVLGWRECFGSRAVPPNV